MFRLLLCFCCALLLTACGDKETPSSTPTSPTTTPTTSSCGPTSYSVGATVSGAWNATSCASGNRRYDQYELTVTQQTAIRVSVTGPSGRQLRVRRGTQYIGEQPAEAFAPSSANPLELKYVLAPGSYVFEVIAPEPTSTASYSLASRVDATATCSPVIFVTHDVTIQERIDRSTDCTFMGGFEDRFIMILEQGQRVNLRLQTAEFAPILVFRDDRSPTAPTLVSQVRSTPGTAEVSWTATFSGFHEIVVSGGSGAGAYTLSVTR